MTTPTTPQPKRRRREKAELSRQGAKSAARGDTPAANPMDAAENTPPATGETVEEWRARRDAWQAGYDQQSEVVERSRPPLPQGRDDEHD
jgi:hypothetical protein